jgi:hypothetical protein
MTDELAALKARIEQLERKAKPPPAPPDMTNWQRYDPTARMTMPRSTLEEMVNAIPTNMVRAIALRDARAPQGPSSQGVIPTSQQMSSVHPGGGGSGWRDAVPLGPQPGINYVDAICVADDVRQRAEQIAKLKR